MAIDWRVDLTNESCMINDIALQDHEEAWRRKPITGCLLNLTSSETLWFGSPSGLYYSRMSEGLIKGEIYSNL